MASDFHGLVVGPKVPCRMTYKRRAAPSVTIAGAAALSRLADDLGRAAAEGASAAGCPVPHGATNGSTTAAPATAATPAVAEKKLLITLDRDLCQGHATCVGECPEVFRVGADGKVETITDAPPRELWGKVMAAQKFCPTRAIRTRTE